jgi:hypothetical protein
MDAAVQYLYFEEKGGHDPVICCSTSGTGIAPSLPGSPSPTIRDSHVATNVIGEDAAILVAAARPCCSARNCSSRFKKLIALL